MIFTWWSLITEMNRACTWRFNPEHWGAIHSTKIPIGKIGPPQKVDPFFRNFSGLTEPIHWVLDRNFRKFWLNGSRPWRLDSKIRFPATARRGWPRFKADAYLEKKKLLSLVLHFTCHAIGNGRYCCLNIGKFLLMILFTCSKFKQRNVFKKVSVLTSYYHPV